MRRAELNWGWWEDGYPHTRTDTGFCINCGANWNEPHYKLRPRKAPVEGEANDGNEP